MVSFGHLVGDMYYATLIPLWPLLIDRMNLTLTDVGFFTSLTSFMLMPVQPFIGWLVDRFPRAWFMILGLIGAALGMSLIGLAPTYSLLMVCVVFGRFCNAMFHPHAAMMVRATSGGRHGTAMSIFTFAGNIGIAVGPLLSVGVVTLFGLESTYLLIPFGFVAAAAIYHFVGVDVPKESSVSDAVESSGTGLSDGAQTLVGPLILLAVLMTFRAAIMGGFTTFLPIFLVDNRAVSLLMGGFGLSALALFGALGGLLGGHLSDRYSSSWVIVISLLVSGAAIFAFVRTDGILSLLFLIAAGMSLFASQPVATVLAQSLAPDRMAMASGVMMGMVWGIGSLFVTPIGMLGDVFGLDTSMYTLAGLAVGTGLASFLLPEFRQRVMARLGHV
ncbi:MAG: MFS transporter [Caldilineaceae bacterium]|nr:MFS transporter [Caldilineaceae bacterium]